MTDSQSPVHNPNRLLVVDDGGDLVGILTRSDLLHVLRIRTELEELA